VSSVEDIAAAVDAETLEPAVRAILGSDATTVEWQYERMRVITGLPDHRGLFRFSGAGRADGVKRPWSAVLKVVLRHSRWSDEPGEVLYWRREAVAFQSGFLDNIAGLTPVRCYAIGEPDNHTLLFWLEDLTDEYANGWPIERYGLAARHLGHMGGEFLAGRQIPDLNWLHRRDVSGSDRGADAVLRRISDDATWSHPDVKRVYPEPIAGRLRAQWEDRHTFREAISQLPVTLAHNDAHTQNLFSRRATDSTQETVAVDWELMGIAPIASDITFLVVASLRRLEVDMEDADALEAAVLDGYIAGLRDMGWAGDESDVRLGYTAAVALRLGLVPQTLDLILRPERRAEAERSWDRPADQLIERWAQVAYFVLERADRAREMLAHGG